MHRMLRYIISLNICFYFNLKIQICLEPFVNSTSQSQITIFSNNNMTCLKSTIRYPGGSFITKGGVATSSWYLILIFFIIE